MDTITFKYNLYQKVKTRHGSVGFIAMRGEDAGGIKYFVEDNIDGKWYAEKDIEATE